MSKTSDEVDEVVFDQPEETAGTMEPDGSVPNRRKEEEWLGPRSLTMSPTQNNAIRPAGR